MGGIVILLAILFGYFTSHLIEGVPPSYSAVLVLGLMVGLGFVGFWTTTPRFANSSPWGSARGEK
jgi:UDP-N-acetylmuramyl pentapeptide phosphotransferase/UDP-N-acetylglucosamine-1-phosphate transferase